ncbi:MAG: hypothetical protein FKY71_15330 [Spiribacter salinus]|uniref:Uncharacterized protein n=1 Tax=Spiribacter salinus TaxID=1335746 RepID=A0A540VN01_9GAMM|nr:MAG: hypothetical protein FKY71_15330 [Spiribacter salinus]
MKQRIILPPSDHERGYPRASAAVEALRAAARRSKQDGKPMEVIIRDWQVPRSDPQRKTLWMWHGEVASDLTVRTGARWNKDDVHELVFLPRFMPQRELVDPETGEVLHRPIRTSGPAPEDDDRDMRSIVSDAMEQYMAWCYQMGIEITVPEEGW